MCAELLVFVLYFFKMLFLFSAFYGCISSAIYDLQVELQNTV